MRAGGEAMSPVADFVFYAGVTVFAVAAVAWGAAVARRLDRLERLLAGQLFGDWTPASEDDE